MTRTRHDDADFVIVGTGAGGATAARVLAASGHSVIMLEEGPRLSPAQRSRGLLDAMSESMRELATTTTAGGAPFPLLLGRCVGGSTAVNSGIVWRLPDDVRALWRSRYGLHELADERALDAAFTRIERELQVAETAEEVRGGNASVLQRGAEALGLRGRVMQRNAPGCRGSARCLQGCPEGARQSMDVSYVPRAIADGARLHALTRATRVVAEHGRASAVHAVQLDATTRRPIAKFVAHARRGVIVAASAIHTPVLLWRSGLRRNVGDGYQAHPGTAMVARFEAAIGMGFGATQAYEIPLRERGIKVESISMPPELLAARIPGAGAQWQRNLGELDHFGQLCAIVRMRARGRVRPGLFGGATVRYEPTREDVARLREAAALLVRLLFAAGAVEVYPGVAGVPERLTHAGQAELLLADALVRRDFHVIASHHFATAAAGADPDTSVVDDSLQAHALPGLYVMDASVLPTNLGVNPQHTIMAVCMLAAERLASASRPPRNARAA